MDVEVAAHVGVVDSVVPLEKLEETRALEPGVHRDVEAPVEAVEHL